MILHSLTMTDVVWRRYVDQEREGLDPSKTVYEAIGEGAEEVELGGRRLATRAYCAHFNFRGADQQKAVGVLSGGERNRLNLARVQALFQRFGAQVLNPGARQQ